MHVETIEQWRDWLAQHHRTETGVWLVTWRTSTGLLAPSYEQQIQGALRGAEGSPGVASPRSGPPTNGAIDSYAVAPMS